MKKYPLALIIAAVSLIIDQVTKAVIRDKMVLWTSFSVIPDFFNIVHVANRGAAFGFLDRNDINWQKYFFIIVTIIAFGTVTYLLKLAKEKDYIQISALGLILGGALGNFIDRLLFSQVTDFLDFYVGSYHWPAFNVADISICIGAALMVISLYGNKNASNSI